MGAAPKTNRSAKDGTRSSLHYGDEGVSIHPSHQGVCGRHGREDPGVTPGELVVFPCGSGIRTSISEERNEERGAASRRTTEEYRKHAVRDPVIDDARVDAELMREILHGQLLFVLQLGGRDAVLVAQPLDDRSGEGFSLCAERIRPDNLFAWSPPTHGARRQPNSVRAGR